VIKSLLIAVGLLSSLNCYGQAASELRHKLLLKRDSLYGEPHFSLKIGLNATDIITNKYTADYKYIPNSFPYSPSPYGHFKYIPVLGFEGGTSFKVYFFKKRHKLVVEPGISFIQENFGFKRVSDSYTPPSFDNVKEYKVIGNTLYTPLLIGITNLETTISAGLYFPIVEGGNATVVMLNGKKDVSPDVVALGTVPEITKVINFSQQFRFKKVRVGFYAALEFSSPLYFHLGTQINF
jgi:hypothetical protein